MSDSGDPCPTVVKSQTRFVVPNQVVRANTSSKSYSSKIAKKVMVHVPPSSLCRIPAVNGPPRVVLSARNSPKAIKINSRTLISGNTIPDGIIKQEIEDDCKLSPTNGLAIMVPPNKKPPISSEYRELFTALFKIKDSKLTARIMSAINNVQAKTEEPDVKRLCTKCSGPFDKPNESGRGQTGSTNNIATQTSEMDFRYHRTITSPVVRMNTSNTRTRRVRQPHAVVHNDLHRSGIDTCRQDGKTYSKASSSKQTAVTPIATPTPGTISHPPSRRSSVFVSDAIVQVPNPDKEFQFEVPNGGTVTRSLSPFSLFGDIDLDDEDFSLSSLMAPQLFDPMFYGTTAEHRSISPLASQDRILQKMKREFDIADQHNPISGMYPIQEASLAGNINAIRRQLQVFKFRKIDINILSESVGDDEEQHTALHFAVLADNPIPVFEVLLKNGANVLTPNSQGDNVLHYLAKQSTNHDLFQMALRHLFTSPTLTDASPMAGLRATNDEGHSLLHILVKHPDKILHLNMLIKVIDEHLHIASHDRHIESAAELELAHLQHIHQFDQVPLPFQLRLHPEKVAFLNQTDSRSGRTALFMAIQEQSMAQVLMLLAHYADPFVADRMGNDCAYIISDSECNLNTDMVSLVVSATCLHRNLRSRNKTTLAKKPQLKRRPDDAVQEGHYKIIKRAA